MVADLLTGIRLLLGTLFVCAVLYPAFLASSGNLVPARATGSLIRDEAGTVIGSRLIAQRFTRAEYLWPRPSAVDYDASAAGGSNLAPSNPALRAKAIEIVNRMTATEDREDREDRRVPGELVAASGSGLDPHITLAGALHQLQRIAEARGVHAKRVEELLRREASASTPWSPRS